MDEINLEVSKEVLMKEHRSIHDLLTTILNRTQMQHKAIKQMREKAKIHAIETTNMSGYRAQTLTEIQKKEKLLKYSTSTMCGWEKYGQEQLVPEYINNDNLRPNYSGLFDLVQGMMARQECLIRVVNEFMDLCPIQAAADKGSEKARSAYRQIMTGTPYGWGDVKISGIPGKGGKGLIKWKIKNDYYYDHQNKDPLTNQPTKVDYLYPIPKIEWMVDEKYMDNVYKNQITTCDIAGKKCFTLCAEEELNHELSNQDVRLFKAKVGYTKIPVDFQSCSGWGWRQNNTQKESLQQQKAKIRAVIYTEERWIAIQDQNGERIMEATGKDKSWAIRTMKQRMKTKMMKQMGLK